MEDRETARMRKYGESKTTRIMMATVRHVTTGLGLRKFQADGFCWHERTLPDLFTVMKSCLFLSVLSFAFVLGLSDITSHSYFLYRVVASITSHIVTCVVVSKIRLLTTFNLLVPMLPSNPTAVRNAITYREYSPWSDWQNIDNIYPVRSNKIL